MVNFLNQLCLWESGDLNVSSTTLWRLDQLQPPCNRCQDERFRKVWMDELSVAVLVAVIRRIWSLCAYSRQETEFYVVAVIFSVGFSFFLRHVSINIHCLCWWRFSVIQVDIWPLTQEKPLGQEVECVKCFHHCFKTFLLLKSFSFSFSNIFMLNGNNLPCDNVIKSWHFQENK